MNNDFNNINFSIDGSIANLIINRPQVKNALDLETISEILQALEFLDNSEKFRILIISGKGDNFCAGADVKWMQQSSSLSYTENLQQSKILARLFYAIYTCRKVVITRLQGFVPGGANGIVAASDWVLADSETSFGFTEVKLGIVPATILPYVLKRIPEYKARQLMLSAEIFTAKKAQQINLIDEIIPFGEQIDYINDFTNKILNNGPMALMELKDLIVQLSGKNITEGIPELTAKVIAASRTAPEGQEGLKAFLEKRKPSWQS
jgi:methylglutaconyl-CoA hydratase